jgi:hypothetical protein
LTLAVKIRYNKKRHIPKNKNSGAVSVFVGVVQKHLCRIGVAQTGDPILIGTLYPSFVVLVLIYINAVLPVFHHPRRRYLVWDV